MTRSLSYNPFNMSRLLDADDPASIDAAAQALRSGGVVAFPTETVYGLGARFDDEQAVARIFEIKLRPRFDPLIVHVKGSGQLEGLVVNVPPKAAALIQRFWPGPLTIVLPKTGGVPDIVTAGLDTVAVRSPSHPVARELLEKAGVPIAAPSANRFGCVSPVDAAEVLRQLEGGPDVILDAGRTPVGVESTIIAFEDETPILLRPGGLPLEEIEAVAGKVEMKSLGERPASPGQLPRHYAPEKPLSLVERIEDVADSERSGSAALTFARKPLEGFAVVEHLSEAGDVREAACNLFAALARLGRSGVEKIWVEKVPEEGLGLAVMDRLRRAAHQD